ncbi:MAG: trypsin-like peptidase domain-containing protein [Chthonomonas sp.]|nr:trypsin-like peptidase domain-containing protein [Chthonomonas sp.]
MTLWKNLTHKPTLWVLSGIAIGGIGAATVISGVGSPLARADKTQMLSPIGNVNVKSMEALNDLDQSFAALTEYVSPAVVHIRGTAAGDVSKGQAAVEGQGSGVIFRKDGYIITNDHVVASFKNVKVVLNDGRELDGKVIRGGDVQNDIAVVKVEGNDLPVAALGSSDDVKPGQFAIAFGAPYGIENTVTVGHISGLGRSSAIPDAQVGRMRSYSNLIQTDAAINPGNSGGPLVNVHGQVIGINTAIYGGGQGTMFGAQPGNVGIGFAIPSNQARFIADLLIEKGKLTRGYLGVAPRDLKPFEQKEKNQFVGALVENDVAADSPAGKAGIKKDDIITRIGSVEIRNQQDLRNAMFKYGSGDKVDIVLKRGSESLTKVATIGDVPKELQASTELPKAEQAPNNGRSWQFKGWPEDSENGDPFEQFKELHKNLKKDETTTPEAPKATGKVLLGIGVTDLTDASRKENGVPADLKGVFVTTVNDGSVADKLGLKAGDVITELNGQKVSKAEEIIAIVKDLNWGDAGSIAFRRFKGGTSMMMSKTFTYEQ